MRRRHGRRYSSRSNCRGRSALSRALSLADRQRMLPAKKSQKQPRQRKIAKLFSLAPPRTHTTANIEGPPNRARSQAYNFEFTFVGPERFPTIAAQKIHFRDGRPIYRRPATEFKVHRQQADCGEAALA